MLRTEPCDNVFLEDQLTASQLLASFSGVRGPDLRERSSVHMRCSLASWGLLAYARWRKAWRKSTPRQRAVVPAVVTARRAVGVTTAWPANAPPAQPGA